MKRLLIYLKEYRKESIFGPLFKLLEASFELFVPLVMKSIIDVGIANEDKTFIWQRGALLFILAAIGLICSITAQYYAAKAAVGFATNVRAAIFDRIQQMTYTEMDRLGVSTMITRITGDVNQLQTGVNLVLRLFLRSPFIVFGAMIMAFTVDIKGAMIFVITIPVLTVVVFAILLISIPLYKKVQAALDGVTGITRENLTGVRVIRAFRLERKEVREFEQRADGLQRIQVFAGRIGALMNPITFGIVNAATLFLLWEGAIRVDAGILTQGAVIALIQYMAQILVELIKLANLIITVTKSLAGADRIADLIDMDESTYKDGQDENKQKKEAKEANESKQNEENMERIREICFENVSFTYQGAAQESLCNINLTAKQGEIIGIIGGTGSGKSTLIHLIPHFFEAGEGEVRINGKNISSYDEKELRKRIGIVPQTAVLFSGTIRDNMHWGKEDASDEEIWEALSAAQAKEFVEGKENGLSANVLQNGKNFSGGQRQRLSIARAFVKKPDVLILDDSTSALDYATEAKVRAGIREIAEESICFIVSQRAASIMDADCIVVLEDGRIEGMGTHQELLKSCDVYAEIYYSQFPKEKEVANA